MSWCFNEKLDKRRPNSADVQLVQYRDPLIQNNPLNDPWLNQKILNLSIEMLKTKTGDPIHLLQYRLSYIPTCCSADSKQ